MLQFMRVCFPAIVITSLLIACVTPRKYTPEIVYTTPEQLDPAGTKSIPLTVRMLRLVDVSPAEDKEDGWIYGGGKSFTSAEGLNGDLAALITEEITKDFQSHGVFQSLTQDQRQEQMRIGGKIHKFSQRTQRYIWWGWGPGWAPMVKEEGEVELELALVRADDTSVKSYRGKAFFLKRCGRYDARCTELNMSPTRYLDQAFTEALLQIRKAIVQDRDLITQQVLGKL